MTSKEKADLIREQLEGKGLAAKYEHAGIYSISIGDKLAYIGKSKDMLSRVAAHIGNIEDDKSHKYKVLAEAKAKGYDISFDVMYVSKKTDEEEIIEDIGYMEGVLIRNYMPPLNTQIPKEGNWRCFNVNKRAKQITLEEIMNPEIEGFYF